MKIRTLIANPWFTVALAVLLAGGGFYLGQRWADNKCIAAQATSQVVSTEVAAEVAALRLANAEYEELAEKALKDVEANKRLSQQALDEAEESAKRARESDLRLKKKEQEWKRQFSDAMNEPKCAELMALSVCPAAPMP